MITLKTLPMASEQEVFNQVAAHLIEQNKRSEEPRETEGAGNTCLYKSGDKACAAGCLIGDDEYNQKSMEYIPWGDLVLIGFVPPEHKDLIARLQHVHDYQDVENWERELEKLAREKNLQWNL